jgi:hypothetical protein|tara:strand:+ start:271 stop:783 length:513 start_codon:yes stop_codon:yes gene_type:complete
MNLPIPDVCPENLVFFSKHMKLRDDRTAVRLDAVSRMAKIVWNEMMNIYRVKAELMGTEDKVALNEAVTSARQSFLADLGVTRKGLIIYVGIKPCWRIDQSKVGLRKGFYDSTIGDIKDAKSKQKLGAIKRQMKTIQSDYISVSSKRYKKFHNEHMARVKTAYDVKFATL